MQKPRIAFVHPFCSHYTAGLFKILARECDIDFFFFSDGSEWYWQAQHGVRGGGFPHEYLRGLRIGNTRITPSLPGRLLSGGYDAILSSIDGRFSMPVAYLSARVMRKPFILWTGIWSRIDTPIHRLVFPLTRRLYRHSDAVVVYGEHVKRYLVTEGVRPERIFVENHAVDNAFYSRAVPEAEKASLRNELGIPPEKKIILFLGRIEACKGLEYLIEAFARLRRSDTFLLIAGTGTERAALEREVIQRGQNEAVRFTGYVNVEEAVRYYALASACVLPSVTMPNSKETWGLVVNEAFNQGVPVIVTDAVGAAAGGLVRDRENGLIIPERDAPALASALELMLENESLRRTLSDGARVSIATWDHEQMAQGFYEAFAFVNRSRRTSQLTAKPDSPPDSNLKANPCPVCGSEGAGDWFSAEFRKCRSCGLIFRHPMPAAENLEVLYQNSWSNPNRNVRETGGTNAVLAGIYAERLAESLGRSDLAGLRILEYGAGRGEFLQALTQRGAETCGVEPYGEAHLRERGCRVYRGLEDIPPGLRFDGIVTVDVIEHVVDVAQILRRFREFLEGNGWLYIATPNPLGLNARIRRSGWREAKKPGHLLFFPARTLEAVLCQTGFIGCRRLRWNVPYVRGNVRRAKDFLLSKMRLDGELRYLAFRGERP